MFKQLLFPTVLSQEATEGSVPPKIGRGKGNPQEDVEGTSQDRSCAPGLEGNKYRLEPIRGLQESLLQE